MFDQSGYRWLCVARNRIFSARIYCLFFAILGEYLPVQVLFAPGHFLGLIDVTLVDWYTLKVRWSVGFHSQIPLIAPRAQEPMVVTGINSSSQWVFPNNQQIPPVSTNSVRAKLSGISAPGSAQRTRSVVVKLLVTVYPEYSGEASLSTEDQKNGDPIHTHIMETAPGTEGKNDRSNKMVVHTKHYLLVFVQSWQLFLLRLSFCRWCLGYRWMAIVFGMCPFFAAAVAAAYVLFIRYCRRKNFIEPLLWTDIGERETVDFWGLQRIIY